MRALRGAAGCLRALLGAAELLAEQAALQRTIDLGRACDSHFSDLQRPARAWSRR